VNRNLSELESREFDLVVVGGGIFGACAALDAVQRGLSVALIDRGDFCGATSAHSFKLIHGGMRYLQHADLYRVRQSSAARRTFLRIAPHLVHPLPIVVPTYGMGMKSKWAMRTAMAIYDGTTMDRNRSIADPTRFVPSGLCLSRKEVIERYPGLRRDGLTGAAVFCDGQMYNPPRLVLAFVKSAVTAGAVAANYVKARRFLVANDRVIGIEARDVLQGRTLSLRAKCVINAAGPYAEPLLSAALGRTLSPPTHWSRDAFFVVARSLVNGNKALALQSQAKDPDARLSRGGRHLFLIPWRSKYTLVGVWHKVFTGDPDHCGVSEIELQNFIDEINGCYSGLDLKLDDVAICNSGLIPFGENDPDAKDLKFGHRSRLVDHASEDGIEGLITLIGVRFTTGPCEAVEAVDRVLHKIGISGRNSILNTVPVEGGDFDNFESLVRQAMKHAPSELPREIAEALVHNHGSAYSRILDYTAGHPKLSQPITGTQSLKAEVVHAVREEMAQTLTDIVVRRTDIGTGECPPRSVLRECAELTAHELQWDAAKVEREIDKVMSSYPENIRSSKNGNGQTPEEDMASLPARVPNGYAAGFKK
jgi:glycerol-3-phosphate dehydrogenase